MIKAKLESELQQGSKEWLSYRGKGIGSSDIGTIMGVNPYSTIHKLWLEKTNQQPPEDLSNNFFVKRGSQLEPLARNLFNENTNCNFTPATFTHKEFEYMRYSSDGVEFDKNEIIEIKCMMQKNHQKFLDTNEPSAAYFMQMQWGLMISEARLCHFIAYNPEFTEPIKSKIIEPYLALFEDMKNKAHWFWHCVTEMKNPDEFTYDMFLNVVNFNPTVATVSTST